MIRILLFSTFTLTSLFSNCFLAQGRLVINNNAFITMNGGTNLTPVYIVIDNPTANAVSTTGTGGNLISENEYNKLRWNIGTNTGSYSIPFTTGTGTNVKIPYLLQITGAGAGGTHIDFSTFPTSIMNFPRPSSVTHMLDALTATIDNSMWVIDRFWFIDAMNYATRPTANMIFDYDPLETNGNSLAAGNMTAQRFDSDQDEWSGSQSMSGGAFGFDNLPQTHVEGVVVPSAEFYEAWTLTDRQNLLPVELTEFSANCEQTFVELNWTTASESNASHYEIQKSNNGISWITLGSIQAQGNTSTSSHYSYRDYNPENTISYYRLKQVDFDGEYKTYDAQSLEPCSVRENSVEISNLPNNQFQVKITNDTKQSFVMDMYSSNGQKVRETEQINSESGTNLYVYDSNNLSPGIYIVSVHNAIQKITQKIIIK